METQNVIVLVIFAVIIITFMYFLFRDDGFISRKAIHYGLDKDIRETWRALTKLKKLTEAHEYTAASIVVMTIPDGYWLDIVRSQVLMSQQSLAGGRRDSHNALTATHNRLIDPLLSDEVKLRCVQILVTSITSVFENMSHQEGRQHERS